MRGASRRHDTSRRTFLKTAALGAANLPFSPATGNAQQAVAGDPTNAPKTVGALFRAEERQALTSLAELVLAGGNGFGVPDYIEQLLTAFDHDPPRIIAGPMGSSDEWLPLTRIQERAWRLRILGSQASKHPGDALLETVTGLRPLLVEGAAQAAEGYSSGDSSEWVWWELSSEFRDAFTDLVIEGSLGDPIYGGNPDGAAWQTFHFEGGMLGYGTYYPNSHAADDRGSDDPGPYPLSSLTRAALWVMGFFSRRIA